jgi:hypothetical protein
MAHAPLFLRLDVRWRGYTAQVVLFLPLPSNDSYMQRMDCKHGHIVRVCCQRMEGLSESPKRFDRDR